MRPEDIKAWRNFNIAVDLLGRLWRAARRHWVVSIPLATWVLVGMVSGSSFLTLVIVGLVTYVCIKKRQERRALERAAYEQAVADYGSPETLARVEVYRSTWPEVARNAGLCQRKDQQGLGTWGAAQEAFRTLSPTARLDQMRKGSPLDGLEVPELVGVAPHPLGVALSVTMLPGQTLATYERAAEPLGHQWDVEEVRVRLERPGVVALTPVTERPLAQSVEIGPANVPAMEDLRSVVVGMQEDGQPWRLPLQESHAVVGGVPGSGKSVFANVLLAGVSQRPDVQIVGIDCAGGVELQDWSPRFSAFATDQDEAIDALELVWKEHERRIEWLKENGYKSVTNAGFSTEMPLLLVLVDEAAQLFRLEATGEQKKKGQQLVDLITRLVTVSRKTGVVVVLATQKPTTNTIPSLIRDNAQVKVSFRVTTPEAATAILGDGASLAPKSPTEIKRDERGVAIAEGADGDLTVVRSFYIDEESDRAIARQYAYLARPLPREVDPDIVDAELVD